MLIEFDIWRQLFADVKAEITPFIERAAKNTDQRIQIGKTINPAFFYAVLLWRSFLERSDFYLQKGIVPAEARAQAGLDVLKRQATRTVIPRFAETFIREVWEMQTRLLNPKPQQIEALAGHARFRAGFDFLLLREKSGDSSTQGMGEWWEHYQSLNADQKEVVISQYNRQRAKTRRKVQQDAVEQKESAEIEPLVDVPEPRSRRDRKTQNRSSSAPQRNDSSQGSESHFGADHPILKRKRVKRDLAQVVFGPTQ